MKARRPQIAALLSKTNALPIELRLTLLFGSLWLVGLAFGLPINLPTLEQNKNILTYQMVFPVLVGMLLQIVFTTIISLRSTQLHAGQDRWLMLKLVPFFFISSFLYFNFKAWMPFVHPRLYDAELYATDQALLPILEAFVTIRHTLAGMMAGLLPVDLLYNIILFGSFFVAFSLHATLDGNLRQRQFVLGLCLNILLGGVSYWIMPAEGPFLYRVGISPQVHETQLYLHRVFTRVVATGEIPTGYFPSPLAAMPSLHVGHVFYFLLTGMRKTKLSLVLYAPLLFWITIEAPTSGWHYLLDLPAGALLAVCSYKLSHKLLPEPAPDTEVVEATSALEEAEQVRPEAVPGT